MPSRFPPEPRRTCRLLHGDCLVLLHDFPDDCVDAILTDPPYGLGRKDPKPDDIRRYLRGERLDTGGDFMGSAWEIPSIAVWKECLRILKPGGYLGAFASTRTWDIICAGIRAAGFERDGTPASPFGPSGTLQWLHGQGFPKSLNIAKKIDDHFGAERVRVGRKDELGITHSMGDAASTRGAAWQSKALRNPDADYNFVTVSTTDEAKKWDGWGTALKPAWEPILCFRKPLQEETIAANIARFGTGGINIDATCVKHANAEDLERHRAMVTAIKARGGSMANSWRKSSDLAGANDVKEGGRRLANTVGGAASRPFAQFEPEAPFYYSAKTSRREKTLQGRLVNEHPTVKPVALMRWLVRTLVPPEGIVLDPYLGSGTTAEAAIHEHRACIGIERDPEFFRVATQRIEIVRADAMRARGGAPTKAR